MKHIFFIGHGVAAVDMQQITIPRLSTVTFYCEQGDMVDGRNVPDMIKNPDAAVREKYKSGDVISEHIFVYTVDVFKNLKDNHAGYQEIIVHFRGERYTIRCYTYKNDDGVDYNKLLLTTPDQSLSVHNGFKLSFLMSVVLQSGLDVGGEYIFHWTACRSEVNGENQRDIIREMEPYQDLMVIDGLVPPRQEIEYPEIVNLV